jgi:hypothetical protein
MPVDKKRYPTNWRKVSLLIRRLAGWRCEWCMIPNGVPLPSGRAGKVVLTVAHLGTPYVDGRPGNKHDKHDIRRENLAALCQACHLRYDLDEHIEHAKETRQRKKRELAQAGGQLPLFAENGGLAFVPHATESGAGCRSGLQKCRSANTHFCTVDPPVKRVAEVAEVIPSDRLKKNTSLKQTHHAVISEQQISLFMPVRGSHCHCNTLVFAYDELLKK